MVDGVEGGINSQEYGARGREVAGEMAGGKGCEEEEEGDERKGGDVGKASEDDEGEE